ncbi:hypothetical protein LOTGIDRAFT_169542 [Lottia gigantea]|uniref:Uncharacterized protein n=1 Tax=Lottia gigantea TaxID=225164 RepID=V3ZL60_LOTGI|nr:hypothetical protein LOTGIDRAFT_169542 [Lottia gigantea]ESO83140.1 hypothetical protein LOTGIDRAFT_169542 [Lottia gigantea]
MERQIEKTPFLAGPEDPAIMIRNRNLRNLNPLPPISYTRHKDAGQNNKMEEANINSALQPLQIHVPKGDRKWAHSYHKPCILPPIQQSLKNSVCDIQNAQNENSDLYEHSQNNTRKKVALITEKIQYLNHVQAHADLTEKNCVTPAINIRHVIPNLEALNFDSNHTFPEKSSEVSTADEPVVEKSLEIVRTEAITKFLNSRSSNRRNAVCKILDEMVTNGLGEYYRRLSINALISVFPDMNIEIENLQHLEAKSAGFTSF